MEISSATYQRLKLLQEEIGTLHGRVTTSSGEAIVLDFQANTIDELITLYENAAHVVDAYQACFGTFDEVTDPAVRAVLAPLFPPPQPITATHQEGTT
jgi:hypothetical protein